MAIKLTSPLFFNGLSGSVLNVGTFRVLNGSTFLTAASMGKKNNQNGRASLKACFATAKKQHSNITKTFTCEFGVCKLRIKPTWPEFWLQYLIDNPGCV